MFFQKVKFVFRYIKHWMQSKSKHSIESSFALELYNSVILSDKQYYAFDEIDGVRQMLEKNNHQIEQFELGAGSHVNQPTRSIASIAKNVSKSEKIACLLFRLSQHFQPKVGVELGTSLGISSLYLYEGSKNTNWITIEGCPEIARYAQKVFASYKADTIQLKEGTFLEVLPEILSLHSQIDFVFFDGDHTKAGTINYFDLCVKNVGTGSIFIFDDIHWSKEMEAAWEIIKQHPKVTMTIDLFWIGLVFFSDDYSKEHYSLRF